MRLGRTWVEPGVRIFVLPGGDGIALGREENDRRLRLTLRMRLEIYKYFFSSLLFGCSISSLVDMISSFLSSPPPSFFLFSRRFLLFLSQTNSTKYEKQYRKEKLGKTRFYLPFFPARPHLGPIEPLFKFSNLFYYFFLSSR